MEKCYVCGGRGSFKHLDRDICKKCFIRNMERRVKKHLGRKLLRKGDRVLVVGGVERVLLERAVEGMPLKITFKESLPKEIKWKCFDKVIVGKTMDEVNEEFLEGLFEGRLELNGGQETFNILESLTTEEAEQYAEIKKIRFKAEKKKSFLDNLKGFKEIKYNLYKNIKELREKFKKV